MSTPANKTCISSKMVDWGNPAPDPQPFPHVASLTVEGKGVNQKITVCTLTRQTIIVRELTLMNRQRQAREPAKVGRQDPRRMIRIDFPHIADCQHFLKNC